MNVKEENICRLCLQVAGNNFEIIDESTRQMFEVLLLRVNLDVSKDPIICKDCAEVAAKCFSFKSTCISTQELILSSAIDKKRALFQLKHVNGKDIETVDNNSICRFCSNHLNESNFILLDSLMADVTFAENLISVMPEMDFDIIKIPIICATCKEDLEYYIKFVENCLDVEEKITKYLQNEGISSSTQVKLSEIPRFLFKNILELDLSEKRAIKQEIKLEDIGEAHSEGYDGELIKTEEVDIKDEGVNFSETTCETPSESLYKYDMESKMILSDILMGKAYKKKYESEDDKKRNQMLSTENISEAHIFKCATCTFETKKKSHLKRHMLIHKAIKEVEIYKCSMCIHETKHNRNLKSHMLIHKVIPEVEMHKCSECTYQAKQKGDLKRHLLIHKGIAEVEMYKCSMCTYQSKRKSNLKNHMLIHKDIAEVEMYKCSMCTYETRRKGDLKQHILLNPYRHWGDQNV